MLPDIGATELLLIAVIALIVVGPKDLPLMMRKVGQFMARLRGMAAEFRASFDEMARQSELDELRKEVEALRRGQIFDTDEKSADEEISQVFGEIEQGLKANGGQMHPPMSHQVAEPPSLPEPSSAPVPAPAESAAAKPAKPRAPKPPKSAEAAKPSKAGAKAPAKRAAKPRTKKAGGEA